jgi:hypothetical protein
MILSKNYVLDRVSWFFGLSALFVLLGGSASLLFA